ncbi:MAG: PilZ domain-containing protein [Terriglobales bacterium]|jgi:hypothetical protein
MSSDSNRFEHRLERRGAQRFEVHLPLAVHIDGRTVPGFTQNVSGRGVFLYAETALPQGAVVELTFIMPSEITLAENMPVRCRGRVLRSSASQAGQPQTGPPQANPLQFGHAETDQRTGIAVQLDTYQYLPPNQPIGQFVRVSAASAAGASSGPATR